MTKTNKEFVSALYEGTFSVGSDHSFKPIDKDDDPDKGALKLSLNPFLIKTSDRVILIDSGAGDFANEPHFPIMQENLAEFGLTEYDVTDIILSHLHSDHIGGLAYKENGHFEMSFQDATIHVSGKEWEKMRDADIQDDHLSLFFTYLDTFGEFNFLDDGDSPLPGITVEEIGGHTEFHLAIFADINDVGYVMAGDVLGTKGAINRKYAAKYDFDGKQSMKMREYLTKRAYEENRIFMCYHETYTPLFKLTSFDNKKGYTTESVTDYESIR